VALCTRAEVQALIAGDGVNTPTVDTALLDACIATAGELIVEETSRIWETPAAIAEVLDGDSARGKYGEILVLRRFPVTYPTDPITVTENGVSLVVAAGYSTSAGVLVKGAGLEDRCRLIRGNSNGYIGWACGTQNIAVGYKAGFTPVPARANMCARELAWLLYQQGRKIGVDQVSQAGSSRHLISQLSDMSQKFLADARRW
jgi:hypothetical protein